ncbi:MAG TPA: carbohydrate kinase family protein [Candidatus Paceibacterota bacterium]|nr:carbohydrate kinase family protein [Candidatus Paceibacterota bacterium]
MAKLDFLAVGDITMDTFIELADARVDCDVNNEHCTITMRWGDKIPFKQAVVVPAVGNSPNAAVSASRLGLASGLLTWMGKDRDGDACFEALTADNVDTAYVNRTDVPTNSHYVLSYESERTILIKHNEFPYALPFDLEAPRYLYLSSLGPASAAFHAELTAWLVAHPDVVVAFQPGTFQMEFGTEALKELYARTNIFFCNKEEAERILKCDSPQGIPELLRKVRELGPETVIITDGRNGAHAFDGERSWFVPLYPDTRAPFERTGAGDAFSSSVTAALALGKPLEEALLWGPVNSMSVVQELGAQKGLLMRDALERFLAEAPEEYRIQPV